MIPPERHRLKLFFFLKNLEVPFVFLQDMLNKK